MGYSLKESACKSFETGLSHQPVPVLFDPFEFQSVEVRILTHRFQPSLGILIKLFELREGRLFFHDQEREDG